MDFFKVIQSLENIQHPAIATSLINLGILQDIDFDEENKKVTATFVWPFANIPIRDKIIDSVRAPLKQMGLDLEFKERVMNEEEKEKFLELEKRYWRGGVSGCGV